MLCGIRKFRVNNKIAPISEKHISFEKNKAASINSINGDQLKKSLEIWVGTWNMNGKAPLTDLSPFIKKPESTHSYHIMAIGTQECIRSIGKSLINSSKEPWEKHLIEYLGSAYKFLKSETVINWFIYISWEQYIWLYS